LTAGPRRPGGAALEAPALAALGAVQTLAHVATWAWWLPLSCIAVLVWRLQASAGPGRAAWLGWCFGCAWLAAGTWWLFISMHRYGHLPAWLAAAAVAALAALLSLYLAMAAAAYRRWCPQGLAGGWLFAACWLLAELARGQIFTGFPWLASGYSQLDGPLAALAPWIGVYGMGAVLALLAAWAASALHARGTRRLLGPGLAAAMLAAAALLGPGEHTLPGRSLSVQLLQPNVAQDDKFAVERMPDTLQWVAARLLASHADLVVAPETAVPLLPDQLESFAPGYWQTLVQRFAQGPQAALIGVPLGDADRGYTNSVAGLSAATAAAGTAMSAGYRYDKTHLVPFGEFIPWGFRWFTEMMRIPLGDFNRGPPNQASFVVQGERAAPNICYEDLFGEELALRFVDPARAPTLFVNVSNIGWFGDTVAVDQHLVISRLRSLEFQLPMLRATNTGATAIIDHRGRVQATLPAFTAGVLDGQVQGRSGVTPFAWWASRFGLWPLIILALAVCAACAGLSRRTRADRPRRPSRPT
jgi:apolipoprotein N-acyltransferase